MEGSVFEGKRGIGVVLLTKGRFEILELVSKVAITTHPNLDRTLIFMSKQHQLLKERQKKERKRSNLPISPTNGDPFTTRMPTNHLNPQSILLLNPIKLFQAPSIGSKDVEFVGG